MSLQDLFLRNFIIIIILLLWIALQNVPVTGTVSENVEAGFVVVSGIVASDPDTNPDLQLSINWDGTRFIKSGKSIDLTADLKK